MSYPYYVHSSVNPTTVCVTLPLSGDNYHGEIGHNIEIC